MSGVDEERRADEMPGTGSNAPFPSPSVPRDPVALQAFAEERQAAYAAQRRRWCEIVKRALEARETGGTRPR